MYYNSNFSTNELLEGLNPIQAQAVEHFEGPALILAGAGSGKTSVLTKRIINLLNKGVRPENILALTFTNKAANEMRERVESIVGSSLAKSISLTTFHSFGAMLLRKIPQFFGRDANFVIYDSDEQYRLIKGALTFDCEKKHLEEVLSDIQKCKDLGKRPEHELQGFHSKNVLLDFAVVAKTYERALTQANAFDFGDLLLKPYLAMRENEEVLRRSREQWQWVLVDEFQDTNACQFELLKMLCPNNGNLFVVGDDDQSIYSWRGAEVTNMLNFSDHYPSTRVFKLEQNYRSDGNILKAANSVISVNTNRYEKALWTSRGDGNSITLQTCESEKDEAAFVLGCIKRFHKLGVPYSEMAILYRNNSLSLLFENLLTNSSTPYQILKGFSFFERAEIKDAIAYLRLLINRHDVIAFKRAIAFPSRGVGEVAVKNIIQNMETEGGDLFETIHRLIQRDMIKGKAKAGLLEFYKMYTEGLHLNFKHMNEQALALFEQSKMIETLEAKSAKGEDTNRTLNVMQLVNNLASYEDSNPNASWIDFLEKIKLDTSSEDDEHHFDESSINDKVILSTIHGAKGLEFKVVFIVAAEDYLFTAKDKTPEEIEEERRLFYVAITRAKNDLLITHSNRRYVYGTVINPSPVKFIYEMPMHLLDYDKVYTASSNFGW